MKQIAIVNGANLNLTGIRETKIYGEQPLTEYIDALKDHFTDIQISLYQSNIEGELINYLHSCVGKVQGIVLNPGGYAHTSIALADAVAAIGIPVVEVHISNIFAREPYRHHSFTAGKCVGSISGLGLHGYKLAVAYLATLDGI